MKYFLNFIFVFCLSCSKPVEFSFEPDVDIRPLTTEEEKTEEEDNPCLDCSDGFVHESFEFEEEETKLSMVFVLDVSRSMRDNLSKLGEAMGSILSRIGDFDWQMAFTTADHGDHLRVGGRVGQERWQDYRGDLPHFGQFMRLEHTNSLLQDQILKKDTPDFNEIFKSTLTLNSTKNCNDNLPPFCQGGHEQPLRALKASLEREENREFFEEADIVIAVVITNEDERVEDPENATTAQEVKNTFYSLYRDRGKEFYGFGIIVNDENCYSYHNNRTTRGEYSNKVAELSKVTQGRNISICQEDYGAALKGISHLIHGRAFDRIELRDFPEEETLQVSFIPEQNIEWIARGKTIFFEKPLSSDIQVDVQYIPAR